MPLKNYIVPVIITGTFGAEARIKAESIEDANNRIIDGAQYEIVGDGYDWNRWNETKVEIGSWRKTEEEGDDE